jgi:hypothetical protein
VAEYTADLDCPLCHGTGNSLADILSRGLVDDWYGPVEPCNCILRQYPDADDQITGYPDHYIVNGDHSGCKACIEKGWIPISDGWAVPDQG